MEYGTPSEAISCGITASKKIGNAVCRNYAKRRLRAALRDIMPQFALPGTTYVFIARKELISCPWHEVLDKVKDGTLFTNKGLHGEEGARASY
jgi:ribonuclease P protein component